jgi:hypothetical protein
MVHGSGFRVQGSGFMVHGAGFRVQCAVCSVQCAVCRVQCAVCSVQGAGCVVVSHTIYQLNGFEKSTPPQDRQLIVLISNSKQYADDCMGELTF